MSLEGLRPFLLSLCARTCQYDCLGSPLNYGNESFAWWTDRNGGTHSVWSGHAVPDLMNPSDINCQCGLDKNCYDLNLRCNCDTDNQTVWLQDEGHLTNKGLLPVTKLNFGAIDRRSGRVAKFQLGPLYCSGDANVKRGGSPASCVDLWRQGITQVGYYMVKGQREKYPKIVFCDLSKNELDNGFERIYGSPGNQRYFAAFDVSLNQPFYDDFRYINFTTANLNPGNHFNTNDGIYTVPYTGTYLFAVHGLPLKRRPFKVQIHRNGMAVAVISNGETGRSMVGTTLVMDVVAGDEMRLFNFGGDIYNDARTIESYFHFVGVLLYSSDRK